jgi:hypothetical protein
MDSFIKVSTSCQWNVRLPSFVSSVVLSSLKKPVSSLPVFARFLGRGRLRFLFHHRRIADRPFGDWQPIQLLLLDHSNANKYENLDTLKHHLINYSSVTFSRQHI